jgi:hypothetical protein
MLLYFVHHAMFLENTIFHKLDLFPSSGKMIGAPTLLCPTERGSLSLDKPRSSDLGQLFLRDNTVGASNIISEDGNIQFQKRFYRNIR